MKVVMLIGNGFNCQIASLISNLSVECLPKDLETPPKDILTNLNMLSQLGFCPDGTYGEINPDHSILMKEENIRIIKAFIQSAGIANHPSDWKAEAKRYLSLKLREVIIEVGERFRQYQHLGGYRDIKKLFRYFGDNFLKLLTENSIGKIHICTTNYDGVLDTLLTTSGGKDAFIFKDGFGNSKRENYKEIKTANFKLFNRYLFHLHGSYRFQNQDGETFKISGHLKNDKPVIVFNNPDLKERIINKDRVLSAYFDKLKTDLKTYDRLIIYGNSLINEPHIKKAIQDNFNRPDTDLIICSLNPNEVEQEIKPYYSQKIYKAETRNIRSEKELLKLFDRLFKKKVILGSDQDTAASALPA
jgi:NAD-dependent SIR2 family protein deacetylase